jgi:predicted O-methyltransferase YrrM
MIPIISKQRLALHTHTETSMELTYFREYGSSAFNERTLVEKLKDIIAEYLRDDYRFSATTGTPWDKYNNFYIGEHYRLLPAIARAFGHRRICEIGTFMGASARCLLDNTDATVLTYDIVEWDRLEATFLRTEDFIGGRLRQVLADLSAPEQFEANRERLSACDMFFIDGPKDGVFEAKLFDLIAKERDIFAGKLFVVDDIRLSTMVHIWGSLPFNKLDVTGLGHWSGTGIFVVD